MIIIPLGIVLQNSPASLVSCIRYICLSLHVLAYIVRQSSSLFLVISLVFRKLTISVRRWRLVAAYLLMGDNADDDDGVVSTQVVPGSGISLLLCHKST